MNNLTAYQNITTNDHVFDEPEVNIYVSENLITIVSNHSQNTVLIIQFLQRNVLSFIDNVFSESKQIEGGTWRIFMFD